MGNTQGVEPTNAVETMKRAAPNVASDAPEATLSKDGLKGHILQWQRFEQGEWRSVGKQAAERAVREPRFVLISFNVWFSQHRQLSRAEELLRVLRRENADVVCLQEATPRFLKTLLADEFVRAHYCVSTTPDRFADLNSDIGYDTFVLCKPWCAGELRRYRVTSRFARSVYINRTPAGFAVATIHLESGVESVRVRGVQMEQIYGLLEELQVADRTFFCGDLNHCVTLGENHLRPTTVDVWPLLRPNDAGWTENEQVNLMLASKPGKHPLVRFDRIVVTGGAAGYEPREIRLLGDAPVAELSALKEGVDLTLSERVFISDHFGLVASFAAKPDQHV